MSFFTIFKNLVIFKGGASTGYKKYAMENGTEDDTYSENRIAVFRVQVQDQKISKQFKLTRQHHR